MGRKQIGACAEKTLWTTDAALNVVPLWPVACCFEPVTSSVWTPGLWPRTFGVFGCLAFAPLVLALSVLSFDFGLLASGLSNSGLLDSGLWAFNCRHLKPHLVPAFPTGRAVWSPIWCPLLQLVSAWAAFEAPSGAPLWTGLGQGGVWSPICCPFLNQSRPGRSLNAWPLAFEPPASASLASTPLACWTAWLRPVELLASGLLNPSLCTPGVWTPALPPF